MLRKSWIAGIIAVACAIGIVFANDGLLERLEAMFGEQGSPHPTIVQAAGTIEVAFSPNNGVTQTVAAGDDRCGHHRADAGAAVRARHPHRDLPVRRRCAAGAQSAVPVGVKQQGRCGGLRGQRDQRPVQRGGRFSAKASGPSRASSLASMRSTAG